MVKRIVCDLVSTCVASEPAPMPHTAQTRPCHLPASPLTPLSPFPTPEYCCNGCVIEDEELGKVLQLQGDQRKNVSAFLISNELAKKDTIKVHGF
jgi:hypothetical protein